ncbi:hypothetical protein [Pseudoalteromonas sp. MMG012]|uniref:hypothetical protein n=1 Tax=Pseudoalteromonas sp. MMG012 TaxID=2822686 RepID=UPI001B39EBB5|nr:hypothetical protein [Pseudoalteromonas sp. MMG012]MBQ4851681.1 hypothetical protein [Pseudoalteromonas sp. MMG012]
MAYAIKASYYALVLLCVGCEQTPTPDPQPAIIKKTTVQMKNELQHAIVTLKGGLTPRLADNVFTTSSTLLLERVNNLASPLQHAIIAMDMSSVSRFELQKRGELCVLYFSRTHNYVPLETVVCEPLQLDLK